MKSAWTYHRAEPVAITRRPRPHTTGRVCEEYVRCIRQAHANGKPIRDIATSFQKLRLSAIRSIINRESWRHVQ